MTGLTATVFAIVNTFASFLLLIVIIDIITILVMIYKERMDSRTFCAWVILLVLLPVLGFVLYLLIGCTLYKKHAFLPKGVTDEEVIKAHDDDLKNIEKDLAENPDKEELINYAKYIHNAGGYGYSSDNDVRIFTSGQEKLSSLFDDLRKAKETILMEYYIIRDDKSGNELLNILIEKVKEGLDVRLMTDSFGNGKGPKEAIKEFEKVGGHFTLFHKTATLILSPKKNNRNHRKIAVIDNSVAYCGGFNIGDEYLGMGPHGKWRDCSVRITGNTVRALETRFICDWNYAAKKDQIEDIDERLSKCIPKEAGTERTHVVTGGPDDVKENPVRMQYFTLIRNAKEKLYVNTPYLIPDDPMNYNLKSAAMSGVDVKIIIPDFVDHIFVYWNTIAAAYELMRSGVRVFMYHNGFNHSKTIVSDEKMCSIGSANLDDRSLVLNFEANLMFYSNKIGEKMTSVFLEDLKECTEYTCEEYENRDWKAKNKIAISRLFKPIS